MPVHSFPRFFNRLPLRRIIGLAGAALVLALPVSSALAQECVGVCTNAQIQRNTMIQSERAAQQQQQQGAGFQRRAPTIEEQLAAQDAAMQAAVIRENKRKEREFIENVLPTLPRFGALAITVDGRTVGISKMAMSQWDADQIALKECGVEGCAVVNQLQNACLSLMHVTQRDGRLGFGWQTTAAGEALRCEGASCKVVETACSLPARELPLNMDDALSGLWGALAISTSARKRAVVTHRSSKGRAEHEAAVKCDEPGYMASGQPTCFPIVKFVNACLGVASGTDRKGTPMGPFSGLRPSREAAQQQALATCKAQGAATCQVVEAACSFRRP